MGVENSEMFITVLHAIGQVRRFSAGGAINPPYDRPRMRCGSLARTLRRMPTVFPVHCWTGHGMAMRVGRGLCIHVPCNDQEQKDHVAKIPSPQDWRYLFRNADRNLGLGS